MVTYVREGMKKMRCEIKILILWKSVVQKCTHENNVNQRKRKLWKGWKKENKDE